MKGKDLQLLERLYDKGIGDEQNINPYLKEIFSDYQSIDPNDETDKKSKIWGFLLSLRNNNLIELRGDISLHEVRDKNNALQTRLINWEFIPFLASITYDGKKLVDSSREKYIEKVVESETVTAMEIVMGDTGDRTYLNSHLLEELFINIDKFLKYFFSVIAQYALDNDLKDNDFEVLIANSILVIRYKDRVNIYFLKNQDSQIKFYEFGGVSASGYQSYKANLIKDSEVIHSLSLQDDLMKAMNQYQYFQTITKTYLDYKKQLLQDKALVKRLLESSTKTDKKKLFLQSPSHSEEST